MTYRLDLGDERLWHGDQPVQISNKAFQLLRLFVSNPNRLLTKDDILEGVWRDLFVSEGLIKEYVHDLRLALGDDPKHPIFIETVRGRGYRFSAVSSPLTDQWMSIDTRVPTGPRSRYCPSRISRAFPRRSTLRTDSVRKS